MRIFRDSGPASLAEVSRLRRSLCAQLEELRLKTDLVDDMSLVVSEAGANIVNHGFPPASMIEVEAELTGSTLRMYIRDDGGPFSAFDAERDEPAECDLLDEHGRGLGIIRASLEGLAYEAGTPNVLTGWRSLGTSRPCVLVIEDSPALLTLYGGFLESDYQVIGCASLEEARIALKSSPIDAILADLHLGDGNSSILLDEADQGDHDKPPIVFISSNNARDVHENCLQFGAEFFITKPVQPRDLRKTIALAIERSGARRAKLNRTFARNVDALLVNSLPEQIGSYRTACIGSSASAGGGDVVMKLDLSHGRHRIVIADVMGHGIAARAWAIGLAAVVRTLHRCLPDLACSGFLTELARLTWDEPTLQGAMATVLIADLDASGVTIASAGHPAPFIFGSQVSRIDAGGALLGVHEPVPYGTAHARLARGDRLVLFTDGVDHRDATGGASMPDWAEAVLNAYAHEALPSAAQALERAARKMLGPQPLDDWTLVLLEKI